MDNDTLLIGVLIEESYSISFKEVCQKYSIPKELLIEMVEQGLVNSQSHEIENSRLNPQDLRRIESAFRLHRDLGINLPGVALALDLLEEMEHLRNELEILRKHF